MYPYQLILDSLDMLRVAGSAQRIQLRGAVWHDVHWIHVWRGLRVTRSPRTAHGANIGQCGGNIRLLAQWGPLHTHPLSGALLGAACKKDEEGFRNVQILQWQNVAAGTKSIFGRTNYNISHWEELYGGQMVYQNNLTNKMIPHLESLDSGLGLNNLLKYYIKRLGS